MSETTVCHVRDRVPDAVFVGRARKPREVAPYGNPFPVHQYGRAQAIALYRKWLETRLTTEDEMAELLIALRGKPLACFCRHAGETKTDDNACHADVLIEYLERFSDEALRAIRGASAGT